MVSKCMVSAVVCAYNEEKRIIGVVESLANSKYIDEVVVVDDGSKDKTSDVVRKLKIKKIKLFVKKKNEGKAKAMEDGVLKSKGKYILFFDADMVNVRSSDIRRLVLPVVNGDVDMTLSLRKNSLFHFRLLKCDYISGERCLRRKFLIDFFKKYQPDRYSVESLMNKKVISDKLRILSVPVNYYHIVKTKKEGFFRGQLNELKMFCSMASDVSILGMVFQFLTMAKRVRVNRELMDEF
jgi:glycosyltransferase involved in cell wall biosynthesis